MNARRWLVGCSLALVGAVLATAALAGADALTGSQGAEEEGALALVKRNGQGQTATKVVTETIAQTTSSTAFVDLPGATTTIKVPKRTRAFLLVRFSAESHCDGGVTGDYCSVRILVDGAEAHPVVGLNYAFDTDTGDNDEWEGHALERVSGILKPGIHTVTVQWAVTAATTAFRVDDWTLVVERIKKR